MVRIARRWSLLLEACSLLEVGPGPTLQSQVVHPREHDDRDEEDPDHDETDIRPAEDGEQGQEEEGDEPGNDREAPGCPAVPGELLLDRFHAQAEPAELASPILLAQPPARVSASVRLVDTSDSMGISKLSETDPPRAAKDAIGFPGILDPAAPDVNELGQVLAWEGVGVDEELPVRLAHQLLDALLSATLLSPPTPAQEPPGSPSRSISAALQPFVASHSLAGAVTLVADKDRILARRRRVRRHRGRQADAADALFWIASQSKPITATALMMLVDEGKVALDDPVEKYLPEFSGQWLAVEQDKDHVLLKKPGRPITSATSSATRAACRSRRRWNSRRSTCCRSASGAGATP